MATPNAPAPCAARAACGARGACDGPCAARAVAAPVAAPVAVPVAVPVAAPVAAPVAVPVARAAEPAPVMATQQQDDEEVDEFHIMFYCSPSSTLLTDPPTRDQFNKTGGIYTPTRQGGRFALNNGSTVYSTSGACRACLNREGASNEWQGPKHVYLRLKNQWVRFNETPYYNA